MSIVLRLISALALAGILSCMYSGHDVLFGISFKAMIGLFIVPLMLFRVFDELENRKYHFRNWID